MGRHARYIDAADTIVVATLGVCFHVPSMDYRKAEDTQPKLGKAWLLYGTQSIKAILVL